MTEWLFINAPMLLAGLDKDLVCRQASRGWRLRLGLANTSGGLAVPLSEMFLLDHTPALVDQLRDALQQMTLLQDIPVSLWGENGITQGLLSTWPIQSGIYSL